MFGNKYNKMKTKLQQTRANKKEKRRQETKPHDDDYLEEIYELVPEVIPHNEPDNKENQKCYPILSMEDEAPQVFRAKIRRQPIYKIGKIRKKISIKAYKKKKKSQKHAGKSFFFLPILAFLFRLY